MEARPREIGNFVDANGSEPFRDWLKGLRDGNARGRIRIRLNRVEAGNLGDHDPVGEGVQELALDFGPGIACTLGNPETKSYFSQAGTQTRDIKLAKSRWKEWKEHNGE
jgi:putative addiction module killer protein